MNKKRSFDNNELIHVIGLLKDGRSIWKIAKTLKVGIDRVRRVIKDHNIDYKVKKGSQFLNNEKFLCLSSTAPNSHINNIIRKCNLLEHDKCACCGISSWNGKPITLEMDHINGSKFDNRLQNLRYLCPNCHSQTPTFRNRNIDRSNGIQKVSDEELLSAINLYPNSIRKVLLHVGLTPKGGNYDRVYNLKYKNNLRACSPKEETIALKAVPV